MKRLLLLLFISILVVSCGKSSNENGVPEKVDIGKEPVSLVYKFKRGDKFTYKMKTIASQGQSMKTDTTLTSEISQTVEYVFDFDVVDVDADKIAELNVTINDVKVDASANGKKFSFKAGQKLQGEELKNFFEYQAMHQVPFRIRVNKIGEVVEVTRTNKIVDNMLKLQGIADSVSAQEKLQFQSNLNEGALKPLVQQFFRRVPEKKVNVDSTWTFDYPSNLMVYKIDNKTTYKVTEFQKINDQIVAKVNLNLQVKWEGKNKMTDRGVNYTFGEPKISGQGELLFNVDRGLLQKSDTNTKLEINILMEANQPRPMKATRKDFTINTNSIELVK